MKSKNKLSTSGEVLQSLFESSESPLSESFIRWKIWAKWEELVGPTIAKNSEPVGLFRGTLYIWVPNSVWLQQMIFVIEPLVKTLNEKLQANTIKQIRLTTDRRSVPSDGTQAENLKSSIKNLSEN